VALIGLAGYLLALARFSPALLLLGFVLGPLIETHLRRALLISRGDPMVFLERPIAAGFVAATVALLLLSAWQAWGRRRRRRG
jgi:putative tricarboxylic transport membrane protein